MIKVAIGYVLLRKPMTSTQQPTAYVQHSNKRHNIQISWLHKCYMVNYQAHPCHSNIKTAKYQRYCIQCWFTIIEVKEKLLQVKLVLIINPSLQEIFLGSVSIKYHHEGNSKEQEDTWHDNDHIMWRACAQFFACKWQLNNLLLLCIFS